MEGLLWHLVEVVKSGLAPLTEPTVSATVWSGSLHQGSLRFCVLKEGTLILPALIVAVRHLSLHSLNNLLQVSSWCLPSIITSVVTFDSVVLGNLPF